jgi:ligand-binding SRPBCC domain-containing protein
MNALTQSIVIAAPIESLFSFHLDPHNLPLVMPSWQKVVDLQVPPEMRPGAEIALAVRTYGFLQHWRVVWEEIRPPAGSPATARLVDAARQSPFASWRHCHEFREVEEGVEMTDHLEYGLPSGFLGKIARPLVAKEIEILFRFRQKRTKDLLEELHPRPASS